MFVSFATEAIGQCPDYDIVLELDPNYLECNEKRVIAKIVNNTSTPFTLDEIYLDLSYTDASTVDISIVEQISGSTPIQAYGLVQFYTDTQTPSEIDKIIWMINGDTIVSNQSLLWSAEISQTSIIEILLIDEQGCEYNASQKVILEVNNHVYVPNIFSIDGEIPFMMISSSYSVDVIEELSVYDRWGSEVYSHKNLLPNGDINSWDGTLNGAECEPGIYIYTIRYKVDSETYFKVGDVLLLK